LCEKVGADVQEVARGIGLDNRIGGIPARRPGLWRFVFPKDTLALIKTGARLRAPAAHRRNGRFRHEIRKRAMARKVVAALGTSLRGKTVAVLG